MKKLYLTCIVACVIVLTAQAQTQDVYATLKKNMNSRASDLYHELSVTKDTLVLKSEKKIDYVYTINKASEREVDEFINGKEYKIPLKNMSEGKHVVVVGQSQMKIVFVVHINEKLEVTLLQKETMVSASDN